MTPSQPFDLSTHLTQDILNMGGEELIAAPGATQSTSESSTQRSLGKKGLSLTKRLR